MFNDLTDSLNKAMKQLNESLEEIEKKLSKDEVQFLNNYKKKFSKSMRDKDMTSMMSIIKDLENCTNKKEAK